MKVRIVDANENIKARATKVVNKGQCSSLLNYMSKSCWAMSRYGYFLNNNEGCRLLRFLDAGSITKQGCFILGEVECINNGLYVPIPRFVKPGEHPYYGKSRPEIGALLKDCLWRYLWEPRNRKLLELLEQKTDMSFIWPIYGGYPYQEMCKKYESWERLTKLVRLNKLINEYRLEVTNPKHLKEINELAKGDAYELVVCKNAKDLLKAYSSPNGGCLSYKGWDPDDEKELEEEMKDEGKDRDDYDAEGGNRKVWREHTQKYGAFPQSFIFHVPDVDIFYVRDKRTKKPRGRGLMVHKPTKCLTYLRGFNGQAGAWEFIHSWGKENGFSVDERHARLKADVMPAQFSMPLYKGENGDKFVPYGGLDGFTSSEGKLYYDKKKKEIVVSVYGTEIESPDLVRVRGWVNGYNSGGFYYFNNLEGEKPEAVSSM